MFGPRNSAIVSSKMLIIISVSYKRFKSVIASGAKQSPKASAIAGGTGILLVILIDRRDACPAVHGRAVTNLRRVIDGFLSVRQID